MVTKTDSIVVFVEYFLRRGVLSINGVAASESSDVAALVVFVESPVMPLVHFTRARADRGFDGRRSIKGVHEAGLY
jgi:hypothetical protein